MEINVRVGKNIEKEKKSMLKRLRKKILILISMLLMVGMLSAGEVHATTYTDDYNLKAAAATQNGQQQMLTSGSRNVYLNLVCPSGTGIVTNRYNVTFTWATTPTSANWSTRSTTRYQLNLGISKTSGTGPQSAGLATTYAVTDVPNNFYGLGSATTMNAIQIPLKITIPAGMHYASDTIVKGATKLKNGNPYSMGWTATTTSAYKVSSAPTALNATSMINNTTANKTVNMYWASWHSNFGIITRENFADNKQYWMYTSSRRAEHTITFARNKYTVKYNGNGSTGGSTARSSHEYGLGSTLTENGFTKSGYAFTGWNTKADGSGTDYTDKQSVTNLTAVHDGEVELFAQWEPCDYTITYSGLRNDDTVGTLPTHADYNQTITIPNPKRTGSIFRGWNITGMDGCTHFYGSEKTTTTELSNIKATTFKNLRETDGTVNFEAAWIETTGEAYAVLNSAGKFTFFRSENNYDNNTTGTFTDIDGNSYSGRVFSDFESLSANGENNVQWLDYRRDIRTVTMAQSVFPVDMSWWFYDCPNAVNIDLSKIVPNDTKKVVGAFQGCRNLKKLNIKTLTSPQLTSMDGMIYGLDSLQRICLGNNFRFTRTAWDEMVI